ncbi:MAG: hypothetical protein SynsKO_07120 [Synoicihabitans sp.]
MAIIPRKSFGWLLWSLILLAGCETTSIEPTSIEKQTAGETTAAAIEQVETALKTDPIATEESAASITPQVIPGTLVPRFGDEIVAAGQFFRTGTPVVLWSDADGYDGYRVERRFASLARADWESSRRDVPALSSPNRYSMRSAGLSPQKREEVRGGSWTLEQLQEVVDQLVLHYDVSGTSRVCFERLHDHRGLSIHFMVDVDGTIYQTLDLKEKAWHATVANSRSIGVEIAQIGAYPSPDAKPLRDWYEEREDGSTLLTIPKSARPDSVRNQDYSGRPIRSEVVAGKINGTSLWQYDFTAEQYAALAHLAAALSEVFPKLRLEVPRDETGAVASDKLNDAALKNFGGLIGHFHIQTNKVDPGPAFQWERVLEEARKLLQPDSDRSTTR